MRTRAIAIVCILFAHVPAWAASADNLVPTPGALLEALRQSDATALDNATLYADVSSPATNMAGDEWIRFNSQIQIAYKDGTWVAHQTSTHKPTPAQFARYLQESPHDSFGREDTAWLCGGDSFIWASASESAHYSKSNLFKLNNEDEVYELANDAKVLTLNKNFGGPQYFQIVQPLLGSGHGYSYCIDAITRVSRIEGGLLRCEATGIYPNTHKMTSATWILHIDPQLGNLVRYAECTGESLLLFRISNHGELMFRSGVLPENALVEFMPDRHRTDGTKITFQKLSDGVDVSLIESAREYCCGAPQNKVNVMDQRGKEPKIYFVDSQN
jgi:hypothetical protein